MEKIRLNKKNRSKALKILKKLDDKSCYDKNNIHIYEDWTQDKVNHIVLQKHNITQETLDNFIDLD